MHRISFLKFASDILECDQDQVIPILYSNTDSCWKITSELKKVEENSIGGLMAFVEHPGKEGITIPLTGVGEWMLLREMPSDSIKPLNMENKWFSAYITLVKEDLNSLNEEEMGNVISGPGILLEHPWRDCEEFYPLTSLIIEKWDVDEFKNLLGLDGEPKQDLNGSKDKKNFQEFNLSSDDEDNTKLELETNCGTQEKVSIKYSKGKPWTIKIQIEPEKHEDSNGKTISLVDFRIQAKVLKNVTIGLLFSILFGMTLAIPGDNYSPLSTPKSDINNIDPSELDRLLDENEDWADPQMVYENIGLQPTNLSFQTNQVVEQNNTGKERNLNEPKTPPENNSAEGARNAKMAKLESLFHNWLASQPSCSMAQNNSTLALGVTSTSFVSATTSTTFAPLPTHLTNPQPLAKFCAPFPPQTSTTNYKERNNIESSYRNKRPANDYNEKSCFLCGNSQHLARNCPLSICGRNQQLAPSHQNNSLTPNSAQNLARELVELAQRHPRPLAQLLFQLAKTLVITTEAARKK